MKHLILLQIFILLIINVFAQNTNDIKKTISKSKTENYCVTTKQKGELKIQRIDSTFYNSYYTETGEMVFDGRGYMGFFGFQSEEHAIEAYTYTESRIYNLFNSRLLSADLIQQAYYLRFRDKNININNLEEITSFKTNYVKIIAIHSKELPEQYKYSENTECFEIRATFNKYEDGWGSMIIFELIIDSGMESLDNDKELFFNSAYIVCLKYSYIEI